MQRTGYRASHSGQLGLVQLFLICPGVLLPHDASLVLVVELRSHLGVLFVEGLILVQELGNESVAVIIGGLKLGVTSLEGRWIEEVGHRRTLFRRK